jgi:hypothetical protein
VLGWRISTDNLAAYKKLYDSVNLTADYRFNTFRRLSSLEGASNVALILSSTAMIVVSFIVILYSGKLGRGEAFITIGQNCLPIIMLALSIMVSGAKYGARAERIHDCAQALNHFKKILKFTINDTGFVPSFADFEKQATKYAEIISKYENHSKVDSNIEGLRSKKNPVIKLISELFVGIIGRGLLYYFYLAVSITSVGWMLLGIYLAVREVSLC